MMTGRRWSDGGLMAALAGVILLSGCANAGPASDMSWTPEPHMDFALAPRLEGQGVDGINSVLSAVDDRALAMRRECLAAGGDLASWVRTVWTPYVGPRFLTVAINDDINCGGAHPEVGVSHYTFDRSVDDVPDWGTLWPAANIRPAGLPPTGLAPRTGAPAIWRWYREAVLADRSIDPELLRSCENHLGSEPAGDDLEVWLDGATGGFGLKLVDLPHAAKACGFVAIMPAHDMARLGASETLLAALRAAPTAFDYSEMPR